LFLKEFAAVLLRQREGCGALKRGAILKNIHGVWFCQNT
tara:strand:+ start:4446 stop:4562 length:117 start_codon:yes stop_codon:yes gene_type:complete